MNRHFLGFVIAVTLIFGSIWALEIRPAEDCDHGNGAMLLPHEYRQAGFDYAFIKSAPEGMAYRHKETGEVFRPLQIEFAQIKGSGSILVFSNRQKAIVQEDLLAGYELLTDTAERLDWPSRKMTFALPPSESLGNQLIYSGAGRLTWSSVHEEADQK